MCRVLGNHYLSNHYLKKRSRRKSQQSRFSNLPSSRSGEGVVGVLDTDLSQRRPVARLAGSWEILDELTFGVSRVDADRWIWSALGIHRVPYEFWKVGTWKPAVNARSTDSHFLSLVSRSCRPSSTVRHQRGLLFVIVISRRSAETLEPTTFERLRSGDLGEHTLSLFMIFSVLVFDPPWKYFAHIWRPS